MDGVIFHTVEHFKRKINRSFVNQFFKFSKILEYKPFITDINQCHGMSK